MNTALQLRNLTDDKYEGIPTTPYKELTVAKYSGGLTNMEKLAQINEVTHEFPETTTFQILSLKEAGFLWAVPADFIRRFPHTAQIYQNTNHERLGLIGYITSFIYDLAPVVADSWFVKGDVLQYVGDYPPMALWNIELAKELGIQYITIHSMQPLPVHRVVIDPVVIGWLCHPIIRRSHNYDGSWECRSHTAGVVLAVWDMDKELEL